MCLWEGGDPYEIESGTLDTIGRLEMMEGCDSLHEGGSPGSDAWDLAAAALKPILHGTYTKTLHYFPTEARVTGCICCLDDSQVTAVHLPITVLNQRDA